MNLGYRDILKACQNLSTRIHLVQVRFHTISSKVIERGSAVHCVSAYEGDIIVRALEKGTTFPAGSLQPQLRPQQSNMYRS